MGTGSETILSIENDEVEELEQIEETVMDKFRKQANGEIYLLAIINGLETLSADNNDLEITLESTERKLSECWEYVCSKAKKEAKNGTSCVADNIVYSWAAEFFQMSAKEYEKLNKPTKRVPKEKLEAKSQEEPNEEAQEELLEEELEKQEKPKNLQQQAKEKSVDLKGQMDLFDFLGG